MKDLDFNIETGFSLKLETVKIEEVEITPKQAEKMLEKNIDNRKLRRGYVKKLAQEMQEGRWLFDGTPIKLTDQQRVLDGQHRLNAIVLSRTTQKFLIITGIEEETFKVMDTGKGRTAGDALEIHGAQYHAVMAAAIKLILNIKNNKYGDTSKNTSPSHTEIIDFYDAHEEQLLKMARHGQRLYIAYDKLLQYSQVVAFLFLFSTHHRKD